MFNLTTQKPDDRDPRQINDWPEKQKRAVVPFHLDEEGVPVNPTYNPEKPNLPEGRGKLWHWGEAVATDAFVAIFVNGKRKLLMIERGDGHGWALPGGCLDEGETPLQALVRELAEETGLVLRESDFDMQEGRYVPDPRAGRAAWMVTVPGVAVLSNDTLPEVTGKDDARRAMWLPANDYAELEAALANLGGRVFAAHVEMLQELLG